MMIAPVGPPALTLAAIVEMSVQSLPLFLCPVSAASPSSRLPSRRGDTGQ
jgi:hypothetical protein